MNIDQTERRGAGEERHNGETTGQTIVGENFYIVHSTAVCL